ncbi:glycosyltransferase, partial [Caldifermentibacillus hisashii]
MTSQTISLCMIVKNEEDFIEQCLQSVQKLVNEIIIVDTGSSDQTINICKNY